MDGKLVIYKQGEGGENMTNIITNIRQNFPNLTIHIMNDSESSEIKNEM